MPETRSTPPESDDEVDESSDESFPASDAPSWAMGKRAEPPHRQPPAPAPGGRPDDAGDRPKRMRQDDRRRSGSSR
jgi:hypothetical protein